MPARFLPAESTSEAFHETYTCFSCVSGTKRGRLERARRVRSASIATLRSAHRFGRIRRFEFSIELTSVGGGRCWNRGGTSTDAKDNRRDGPGEVRDRAKRGF